MSSVRRVISSVLSLTLLSFVGCAQPRAASDHDLPAPSLTETDLTSPQLIVLGIAQDAGVPQIGTDHPAFDEPRLRRHATCLGLVANGKRWLFEATPDIKWQLHRFDRAYPPATRPGLDGIFITHAHIGHYTGLMMLGHEAMGAHGIPVHVMPRMRAFLEQNGPWSQLVAYDNIELHSLEANTPTALTDSITVTPFLVPHRQEYAEVVGFEIAGPNRRVLFLPDIDSWHEWDAMGTRIEDALARVDVAFLDATFFANGEIPGRDMSGFPHPFIRTTMERLGKLPATERAKVHFIHLNHTNPALDPTGDASREIQRRGFRVAYEGQRLGI